MRAAIITAPGRVVVEQVPVPMPGPGEVLVRLEGSGVCASSLPVWEGREWFQYPLPPGTPGHEGWGRVAAVGAGVEEPAVGDRVAIVSGRAFAAYDVAPADAAVKLPAALAGRPFPGEPIGCAMNVFHRSGVEPGQTVAVVGIGFLGALLTRLASQAGARVLAISRRPYALQVAREAGAAETIPFEDPERTASHVLALTGGAGCERVIEAVGEQATLDLATAISAERGRLIIAGYHQDGLRRVNLQVWNWRGLDVINAHERDPRVYAAGVRAAVDAVVSGRLDPDRLYARSYRLEELGQAFEDLRRRPEGFVKALVTT